MKGKSWSLARSIDGKVWGWGFGYRGQLGLGSGPNSETKMSIFPRLLESSVSILQLSSCRYHNTAIGVQRKYFNEKNSLDKTIRQARAGDIFSPVIPMSLTQTECSSQYKFDCCRRHISHHNKRKDLRYYCHQCKLSSICYVCASVCHRGHLLLLLSKSVNQLKNNHIRLIKRVTNRFYSTYKTKYEVSGYTKSLLLCLI
jgi:hypothetical protein